METRKKILIADDDQAILEAMTLMLEDAGYEVMTTIDGTVVNDMINQLPDLLLLDIWMSGIEGQVVCKNWKSQEITKSIPIIIISANTDTEQIAKDCGADDYLAKPFDMHILLSKISRYIG